MTPLRSILGHSRRPDITFFPSGRIDISSRIVRALSIRPGDAIDILAAGDGEYYLYIAARAPARGRHHARCYPTKIGYAHFRVSSRPLARAILAAVGSPSLRASLPAGDPLTVAGHIAIPLITRNNLNS